MAARRTTSYVSESVEFAVEAGAIDRERGIIRNVRVCGPRSRNGRKYPVAVLEKHLPLYAASVNVGHHRHPVTGAPIEVPPYDKFGRIVDPVVRDGGINGTLKYNPEHPFAKPFLWAAEHDPAAYSFSPFKQVLWRSSGGVPFVDADGDRVAESILSIASVDVVDTGGTTSGIFESFVRESAMDMPNATEIAGQLETDGAWVAFLTDLFANMKGVQPSTKDTITALVTSALANSTDATANAAGDGTDPAAVGPAMESLRRCGPVGRWAAKRLDTMFVAEANAKRIKSAQELIKAELVPEALITPVFVETVAESLGNTERAKAIIADRKKLSGGGAGGKKPETGDRAGAPSIKDLVEGYVAG